MSLSSLPYGIYTLQLHGLLLELIVPLLSQLSAGRTERRWHTAWGGKSVPSTLHIWAMTTYYCLLKHQWGVCGGGAMVIITEFLSLDIVSCLEMRINMFKQFVGHILTARCESTSSIRLKRVTLVTRSTPERKEKKPNMVYLCFLKTQFWGRLCHC